MVHNNTASALAGVLSWPSGTPAFVTSLPWPVIITVLVIVISIKAFVHPPNSPSNTPEVNNLPGPKRPWYGWLLGNMVELGEYRDTLLHPDWIARGWTGTYESLFMQKRLFTFDPVAVQFIFAHPDDFERPGDLRTIIGRIMGEEGIVAIEGDKHRRQRRVLNPAFSTGAIRDMLPCMYDKAYELEGLVGRIIDDDNLQAYASPVPPKDTDIVPGARKVDVLKLANVLTTDVIGLAAFEHDFKCLSGGDDPDLLAHRLERMVNSANTAALIAEAQNTLPILDLIPTANRKEIAVARAEMERLSDVFVDRKKTTMDLEATEDRKDLLSILVKANVAPARPDLRLTDIEVRAQLATLMFAGSTTTAGTLSALLYRLAQHPDIQQRLRDEINAVGLERPSYDTLNSLPLLDYVIREVLRLNPPATCTARAATRDIVVPLSKPVRGKNGKLIESLPVVKGSYFFLSMACLNRLKEVWGPDAEEFNPDRHADPNLPMLPVPGIWGNVSSFINGPHHCIGYRLAIAEIKTALYALLPKFEFAELPSKPEILFWTSLATRPHVKGEQGGQLPLLVRRIATVADV